MPLLPDLEPLTCCPTDQVLDQRIEVLDAEYGCVSHGGSPERKS